MAASVVQVGLDHGVPEGDVDHALVVGQRLEVAAGKAGRARPGAPVADGGTVAAVAD